MHLSLANPQLHNDVGLIHLSGVPESIQVIFESDGGLRSNEVAP